MPPINNGANYHNTIMKSYLCRRFHDKVTVLRARSIIILSTYGQIMPKYRTLNLQMVLHNRRVHILV